MYRLAKGTEYILLIVYVDDLLYIGSTDDITNWFEGELQQDLTLTVATTVVRGPLSKGLGLESQCVHFGHPCAGGCQRSTGDP
ncbi:unnamed protein product [Closterium sp. NIES-54]